MKNYLVSVIIPSYNSEKTICRCLDSVFKQTYQNFEIVICDDKSKDNTRDLLKSITDPRVSIYYLNENGGSAVARNTAMQNSKGELFAFLDSDDEWYPEKLEEQILYFKNKNVGIVFAGAKIVKNEKKVHYYKPKTKWENESFSKLFLGQMNYMTPTAIFKKECVDKSGLMAPELRRNQDYDFFLRILKNYELKIIEKPLAIIHVNTKKATFSRLENSIGFYEAERLSFFKENFTEEEVNLFFARKYRDLCGAMLRSGEFFKSIKPFKKSLNYSSSHILKPDNLFLLFKSVLAGTIYKLNKNNLQDNTLLDKTPKNHS
jgi:glycosyltransferase involved in cell wall biosynthesis